jgi:2-dehydropantoate 2-reductase
MRILIVGAGSVGQVYGYYLQRGGCDVHVYVRDRYAAEAAAGFVLYPPGARTPVRFTPAGVHTGLETVRAGAWDQVWLCVPSDALRGPSIPDVVGAAGGATVISLLPGLRDRDALLGFVPAERLGIGLITFSSWHAPLAGEALPEPGMAWWNPPMTPNLFEGPGAEAVVTALRRGGAPAAVGSATRAAALGSSLLVPIVAAMEVAGWSFAGLRGDRPAALAAAASQEALTISAAHGGFGTGPHRLAANLTAIRLLTWLAPLLTPMDFEVFLRVHFSKVGVQTMLALDTWITEGERRRLPVSGLQALRAALAQARADRAGGPGHG